MSLCLCCHLIRNYQCWCFCRVLIVANGFETKFMRFLHAILVFINGYQWVLMQLDTFSDSVVEYQGLEKILFASIKESILVSSCCCSIAQGCPRPPALLSLLSRPPFSHRPPPPLPLLPTGGTETWAESYKAETWKLYLGKTGPRPLFSALYREAHSRWRLL